MGGRSLRELLWRASDWSAALASEAAALRGLPIEPGLADAALALAEACEELEPDRTRAVEMHLLAWRCGRQPAALARARALCLELGDLATVVKIARLEYQHSGESQLLVEEGLALLDLDQPDQAIKPLVLASRARPDDPQVTAALAAARREWPDPRAELDRLLAVARELGAGPAAAPHYFQAARVIRSQQGDEQTYGRLLLAAFECAPRDDRIYGALESYLLRRGRGDELIALYRRRLEDAPDLAARFDDLRRAGTLLVTRGTEPGLGLRLLDRALREAYARQHSARPGQLACLVLLRRNAEAANLLPSYLGLLAEALAAPQDERATLWLALTGLDVAWRRLGQIEVARSYAGRIAELAPAHPELAAFVAEVGLGGAVGLDGALSEDSETVYLDAGSWSAPPVVSHASVSGELTLADEPPIAAFVADGTAVLAEIEEARPADPPLPPPDFGAAAPLVEHALLEDAPTDIDEAPDVEAPDDHARDDRARDDHAPDDHAPADEAPDDEAPDDEARDDDATGFDVAEPTVAEAAAPDLAASPAEETTQPQTLGRIALVTRPAAPPPIPRGALDALRKAAGGPAVPAPAPVPANARDRAARVEIPIDLRLEPIEGAQFPATTSITRDLSTTGLFLLTPIELMLGDTIAIELRVPSAAALDFTVHRVRARVVRRAGAQGYGVVFIDPPPALTLAIEALAPGQLG